jgi:putative heme-binding domain-containing protein
MRKAVFTRAHLGLAALGAAVMLAVAPLPAQDELALSGGELARARQLYQAHCGRCHGVLGLGGEGPGLAVRRLPRAPDHASVVDVIRNGIPGTGMPGLRATILPDAEASLVAAYVISLRETELVEIPGDPVRGREVFETTGVCYSCHIVAGRGVGIGPELSGVGMRRGADYLRAALVDPAAELPIFRSGTRSGFVQYLPLRAVTHEGVVYEGMRANEDAFTVQLTTGTGSIVSLRKADLAELEKRFGHSLMPATANLSSEDIDNLIAYLASLGG